MKTREVCAIHGGKTPRAAAAPGFVHGRSIRSVLPSRYVKAFDAAMSDAAYISLRDQMALVKALGVELVERMDRGESGELWALLHTAAVDFRAGLCTPERLIALIEHGYAEEQSRREIERNAEAYRRMADTERRMVEAQNAYMTPEEIAIVSAFWAGLVHRVGTGKLTLRDAHNEARTFFQTWRIDPATIEGARELIVSPIVEDGTAGKGRGTGSGGRVRALARVRGSANGSGEGPALESGPGSGAGPESGSGVGVRSGSGGEVEIELEGAVES